MGRGPIWEVSFYRFTILIKSVIWHLLFGHSSLYVVVDFYVVKLSFRFEYRDIIIRMVT